MIFTLPALFIWQREDPTVVVDVVQVGAIALFGGLLGVLFMIPLRSYLNQPRARPLAVPRGNGLRRGAGRRPSRREQSRRLLFQGLGIGALYQVLANSRGLALWNESPAINLPRKAQLGGDFTPELLGVGFIIGPRIAAIMFGGGALAWLILIPAIDIWGDTSTVYPAAAPMNTLASGDIWNSYIRYVGAGAVGFAGIVTLVKSMPTILESFRLGFSNIGGAGYASVPRTQQDMPFRLVGVLAALMAPGYLAVPRSAREPRGRDPDRGL